MRMKMKMSRMKMKRKYNTNKPQDVPHRLPPSLYIPATTTTDRPYHLPPTSTHHLLISHHTVPTRTHAHTHTASHGHHTLFLLTLSTWPLHTYYTPLPLDSDFGDGDRGSGGGRWCRWCREGMEMRGIRWVVGGRWCVMEKMSIVSPGLRGVVASWFGGWVGRGEWFKAEGGV